MVVVVVVDAGHRLGGGGGVEKVDTLGINSPDRRRHRPVTRQNGDGNVTGDFFLTRPRSRDSRTRDPARVCIPVSITILYRSFESSLLTSPLACRKGYSRTTSRDQGSQ